MEKKVFLLLILCTVVLGGSFIIFITANKTSLQKPMRTNLDYSVSFSKEKSEKIYEILNDEERYLQKTTSYYVGYKLLTGRQINALKAISEKEMEGGGVYIFDRMLAIGETTLDEHLTADDIYYIANLSRTAKNWGEVMDRLEKKQKYPDFYQGGNGYPHCEYWLEGKPGGMTLYITYGYFDVNENSMTFSRRQSDPLRDELIGFSDLAQK